MDKLTKDEVLNQLEFKYDNLIFLTLAGSRLYGLDRPESDYDYRGIGIPSLEYFLTNKNVEQAENKSRDITIFSIQKFFQLASNVNPNIVELLFIEPDDEAILYKSHIMDRIFENKHLFLSKKAEHSFSGYAFSQLHRIKGHKKWLDNPLTEPKRKDYKLPKTSLFGKEKIRVLATLGKETLKSICKDDIVEYIEIETKYFEAIIEYQKYKEWKKNRNPERAKIEAKMGFDCKHAMHLFRLLRMAKEIATEKTIHTRRPDANFLKRVREGEFSYEQIIEMAEKEEKEVHELFEKSDLPYTVDYKKIDDLLFQILKDCFKINI